MVQADFLTLEPASRLTFFQLPSEARVYRFSTFQPFQNPSISKVWDPPFTAGS